jgi:hypothetical protein
MNDNEQEEAYERILFDPASLQKYLQCKKKTPPLPPTIKPLPPPITKETKKLGVFEEWLETWEEDKT